MVIELCWSTQLLTFKVVSPSFGTKRFGNKSISWKCGHMKMTIQPSSSLPTIGFGSNDRVNQLSEKKPCFTQF